MSLQFYNTLSLKLEPFQPINPDRVSMYTCGPTVYDFAHIGNFRAYIFEDLLQRHLEFRGFHVDRVMNLTDVDDKTIRGAKEKGIPLDEFTRPYKDAFFRDLNALRIRPARAFPEATAHTARMIDMISRLIKQGQAYQAPDGSVYFRIRSFPDYGRLAHIDLDQLQPGARISSDEYEKEEVGDFALWKAWSPADAGVAWDSPWGKGRPGWHIECSAMATGLLGDQIDIHCGGEDNIFPHHEAEIAQSECFTGKQFVRLWMHCRHLLVNGKKMSKSEGNFHTLRDLLERGWTGREVRYALISVRYREPLNFTFEGLEAARAALARFDEWSRAIDDLAGETVGTPDDLPATLPLGDFANHLDDDLNISAALGSLFDVIRGTNRLIANNELTGRSAAALRCWRDQINDILAIAPDAITLPEEIQQLANQRQQARSIKDWAKSDQLRDQILAAGWQVKDTKEGQKITPSGCETKSLGP